MNTYYLTVQVNAEIPPQQFYCDADRPGDAIVAALEQLGTHQSVVVACNLYANDVQVSMKPDWRVVRGTAVPA